MLPWKHFLSLVNFSRIFFLSLYFCLFYDYSLFTVSLTAVNEPVEIKCCQRNLITFISLLLTLCVCTCVCTYVRTVKWVSSDTSNHKPELIPLLHLQMLRVRVRVCVSGVSQQTSNFCFRTAKLPAAAHPAMRADDGRVSGYYPVFRWVSKGSASGEEEQSIGYPRAMIWSSVTTTGRWSNSWLKQQVYERRVKPLSNLRWVKQITASGN